MDPKNPESTELEQLKKKCLKKDGTPRADAKGSDLARLKILIDGQQLSQAEIEEAKKREEARKQKEIDDYKKRKAAQTGAVPPAVPPADPALNAPVPPAEHPRITALKQALMPFTQLEVNETRPDEFIMLVTGNTGHGGKLTAGDVRNARKAMAI